MQERTGWEIIIVLILSASAIIGLYYNRTHKVVAPKAPPIVLEHPITDIPQTIPKLVLPNPPQIKLPEPEPAPEVTTEVPKPKVAPKKKAKKKVVKASLKKVKLACEGVGLQREFCEYFQEKKVMHAYF